MTRPVFWAALCILIAIGDLARGERISADIFFAAAIVITARHIGDERRS